MLIEKEILQLPTTNTGNSMRLTILEVPKPDWSSIQDWQTPNHTIEAGQNKKTILLSWTKNT